MGSSSSFPEGFAVTLTGPATIVSGKKAIFHGRVNSNTDSTISWQKGFGDTALEININEEKYKGSSTDQRNPQLQINDVDLKDQDEYLLVVRTSEGTFQSNKIKMEITNPSISKEEINLARYIDLNRLATEAMRTLFDQHIPRAHLVQHITDNSSVLRQRVTPDQRNLLFDGKIGKSTVSSKHFDIPLMYIILRNTCTNQIKNPSGGWGKEPDAGHTSLGDDLERFRFHRNNVMHQYINERYPKMSQDIFDREWSDLSQAIIRTSSGTLSAEINNIERRKFEMVDLKRILSEDKTDKAYFKDPPKVRALSLPTNCLKYGGEAKFEGIISTPNVTSAFWQKIEQGIAVKIEITKDKFKGSSQEIVSPRLVINSLDMNDTGTYQLLAENDFGVGRSDSIFLDMEKVQPIAQIEVESKRFTIGSNKTITGVAKPPKETALTWWKIHNEVPHVLDLKSEKYVGSSSNPNAIKLVINSASYKDVAIYQLVVTNPAGEAKSNQIELTAEAKIIGTTSMSVDVESSTEDVDLGDMACGILNEISDYINENTERKEILKYLEICQQLGKEAKADRNVVHHLLNRMNTIIPGWTKVHRDSALEVLFTFTQTVLMFNNKYNLIAGPFLSTDPIQISMQFRSDDDYTSYEGDCRNGQVEDMMTNVLSQETNLKKLDIKEGDITVQVDDVKKVELPVYEDKSIPRTVMFLAAIDIGTVFSGFATAAIPVNQSSVSIGIHKWRCFKKTMFKAPTSLLLNPNKSINKFGYRAELKHAKMWKDKISQEQYFFFQSLHKQIGEKTFYQITDAVKDLNGKPLHGGEIYTLLLEHMMECVFKDLKAIERYVRKENVFFVINVPVPEDVELCKKQIEQLGLQENYFSFVQDTMAAALYFRDKLPEGVNTFFVLDIGGGTINCCVHKLSGRSVSSEVNRLVRISRDGDSVTHQFETILSEILGKDVLQDFIHSKEYLKFSKEFENRIENFHPDEENALKVELPVALKTLVDEILQNSVEQVLKDSKYGESLQVIDKFLHISVDFLKLLFEPSIGKVEGVLENAFQQTVSNNIKTVCVCGGFANCKLLQLRLKKYKGKKFIFAENAETVILKGCILRGQLDTVNFKPPAEHFLPVIPTS